MVVNVEYRLSPEHKFPACYTDAEAVVRWALDNKQELANNSSAIVGVGGDSAGGSIAATVCYLVEGLNYQVIHVVSIQEKMLSSHSLTLAYLVRKIHFYNELL